MIEIHAILNGKTNELKYYEVEINEENKEVSRKDITLVKKAKLNIDSKVFK